ncbi:fluoride efflux transporter CrcB [Actinoalloteichus sp. AHMU CJ021]|uniref:fluoride efflux transporter CrcB n=1 Tax=Actinoalloteichus sp. AHMU CJ021 TaxID=2072503 RepID=UPI0026B2F63D
MLTSLLVAVGAGVGAPLRYLVDRAARRWYPGPFPLGTLLVNVSGSLVFGLLAAGLGAGWAPTWSEPLLGAGLCGAFTTYSTFAHDTLALFDDRRRWLALANVGANLALGLAAAALGWGLGSLFLG